MLKQTDFDHLVCRPISKHWAGLFHLGYHLVLALRLAIFVSSDFHSLVVVRVKIHGFQGLAFEDLKTPTYPIHSSSIFSLDSMQQHKMPLTCHLLNGPRHFHLNEGNHR